MEGTPLYEKLEILETPNALPSLTNDLSITVLLYKTSEPDEITVTGLGPFHTIEDVSRAIWIQQDKDERLFPKYTYLAVEVSEEPGRFTPATRTWYSGAQEDSTSWVTLENPIEVISRRKYQEAFVDAAGEKKESIRSVPRGRVTLEAAFLKNGGELPVFHCFTLSYLFQLYTGPRPLAPRDWFGLFYPYFPHLPNKSSYTFTEDDKKAEAQQAVLIEAKLKQTEMIDALLSVGVKGRLRTTQVKKLYFSWKKTVAGFEGVDTLFYSAPVNAVRPFMRLLTTNTIPMTKLYQPELTKPPMVHDTALLRTWVSERAPDSALNTLFIKALVRQELLGSFPIYGTFRINDDATADFTVQPPKQQRILEFNKDLVRLGQVMTEATMDMPFSVQDAELSHADIAVELDFGKVAPRDIRKTVLSRLTSLGTFFQPVVPPSDEKRTPLICLRYKAVNNFITQDRVFSYLTYLFQRTDFELEQLGKIAETTSKEFDISVEEAERYIKDYITKKNEITVADPEGKEFEILHNTGTDIAIYSHSVSAYNFHIYNLQSITDLQRIVSILGCVFTAEKEDWLAVTEGTELPDESAVSSASIELDSSSNIDETNASVYDETSPTGPVSEGVSAVPTVQEASDIAASAIKRPTMTVKPAVVAAPKPAAAAAQPQAQPKGDQKIQSYQFLIKRLQKIDPMLFKFDSSPGIRVYSSQCGDVDDRQPEIFTQDEYLRIRSLYGDAEAKGKVGFIEMGVPDTEKQERDAKGKHEQIVVLRYGSNPGAPNYFMCSAYFCLRDLMPLLKDDFVGKEDYQGKPKPPNTCPFCRGTLITNKTNPEVGQTVIKRANRPKSDRPHLFVGFGKLKHPKGYELPCCFAIKKLINWSDPRFKLLRDAAQGRPSAITAAVAPTAVETNENLNLFEEEEAREDLEQSLKLRVQQLVNFEQLRYKIGREYIVGPEKFPLEPGKVGLPSLALDAYFGQDSTKMVERPSVKMEFVGNARGFFRLGVFNKASFLSQSLFAALAPFLGKNSVPEVVDHIKLLITPRVFINLNFGNLMLEFFNPTDPEPSPDILNSWALKHLQIYKSGTEPELSRFYRSYRRFLRYLEDPNIPKQMRHFSHALAEPGLLTPNGLNLITLEYMGDPRDAGTRIEASCPLLGVDMNRYTTNNVGFLTHSQNGVWEPIVYVDRVIKKEVVTSEKEGYYSISQQDILQPKFPNVLRVRYMEYLTQCRSSYRGAFTFQSHVDNRILVPVTRALEILQSQKNIVPTGLLRDSYNHLVAITVKNPYSSRTNDILVPVVDDGNSFHYNTDLKVHIGVQSISLASAVDTVKFYKQTIEPLFQSMSPVYTLVSVLKTVEIVAYRLGDKESPATILLPCRDDKQSLSGIVIEEIEPTNFQFEYEINRKLLFSAREDTWEVSPYLLARDQTQDLYGHLRLSFANWIVMNDSGAEMRKRIDELLERDDVPNYEKLRRLQLEYGPLIESWLSPDPDYKQADFSLVRKDCIAIDVGSNPDQCSGMCIKAGDTCKIHTPQMIQLGSKHRVEAVEYFSLRLFDEILRIPARRYELFHKGVKRFQVPKTNLHIGSEWILPENVPAWYDLIRDSGVEKEGREIPRYYEEFSRSMNTKKDMNLMEEAHLVEIPETLKAELPQETVPLLALRILGRPEDDGARILLRYFGMESQYKAGKTLDPGLLEQISKKFKNTPVVRLDLEQSPIGIVGRSSAIFSIRSNIMVLLPNYEEGPALIVMKDTLSDSIPADYVRGRILDSIVAGSKRIKKIALVKPVLSEENQSIFETNTNAQNIPNETNIYNNMPGLSPIPELTRAPTRTAPAAPPLTSDVSSRGFPIDEMETVD